MQDGQALDLANLPPPTATQCAALRRAHMLLAGFGSIGRPLAQQLATWGVSRFTLVDPKPYRDRSVASQCDPGDVGRLKVAVGAERLRSCGATVTPLPRDLYTVPDGFIDGQTLVVASLDNRRADIGANRWATRMGARVLKINVEPAYHVVAVRGYDLRARPMLCVECQFTDRHYQQQRHPESCDDPGPGRQTNSPRSLSRAAARLGALAVAEVAADTNVRWFGHQWQYWANSGEVQGSRLSSNPKCRWDHQRRWPHLKRLGRGASNLSLSDLLGPMKVSDGDRLRVRFCQQVALRGRCVDCGLEHHTVRWVHHVRQAMQPCSACGGWVCPIPFYTFCQLTISDLTPVLKLPFRRWGVEPCAVIEIRRSDRAATFVLGD